MTSNQSYDSVMTLHWVILKHTTAEGVHWDLMLEPEAGQKLMTWRITSPPAWLVGNSGVTAERIGDHRPAYLTYEGEISRNRGQVVREASGVWRPDTISEDLISGQGASGHTFRLARQKESHWLLTVISPNAARGT